MPSSSAPVNQRLYVMLRALFFFFNDTATTEIYTLSLHDLFRSSQSAPSNNRPDVSVMTRPSRAWRGAGTDRKSTRLNSSHTGISHAVFCLKKYKSRIRSPALNCTATPEDALQFARAL